MGALAQALCFCALLVNDPSPQMAQSVGDIWYTHESLGHGRHLLRLSTTDLIIDWNHFRKNRLYAFAEQFADQTCQGRYKLAVAERSSWPKIRPIYARQFVFRCRSRPAE